MILEAIHNINLPTRIKKDVENKLVTFLDASMRLIYNDREFSNNTILSDINIECSNYIKSRLNLDLSTENLPISLLYLLYVIDNNKMNSNDFVLLNEKRERIGVIPGAKSVRKLLEDKLIPFYKNQIYKIFKNSDITQGYFRTQVTRDVKLRIKKKLNY